MSLSTWPVCSFWYHRSQHFNNSFVISVLDLQLCSNVTYHLVLSGLNVMTVSLPLIPACVVSLKVLFLVHYSLLCILILSVSLFHLSHRTITFMLTSDDTHLFFSFCQQDLDLTIACLQNALHQISSWMTANIFTVNVTPPTAKSWLSVVRCVCENRVYTL